MHLPPPPIAERSIELRASIAPLIFQVDLQHLRSLAAIVTVFLKPPHEKEESVYLDLNEPEPSASEDDISDWNYDPKEAVSVDDSSHEDSGNAVFSGSEVSEGQGGRETAMTADDFAKLQRVQSEAKADDDDWGLARSSLLPPFFSASHLLSVKVMMTRSLTQMSLSWSSRKWPTPTSTRQRQAPTRRLNRSRTPVCKLL